MEVSFPKLEEEVLERWRRERTFEKSVERRRKSTPFIFYEGPPTANGKPGIHHVLSRSFKDVVLRYKTMRGFLVERRAGWDTHGLPVELQIEKKLGLKSKKDIEKYGIAKFNKECKKSVWEYKKDWEDLTERMGFWIDLKNPYITYETSYIETLWFLIKKFWERGLLYKDYKVVPYCSRCGTSLSSHEMALGYEAVKENSLYVRFEVLSKSREWENTAILSWTTTPWTLPGNVALAVNPKAEYICIPDPEKKNHWLVLGFENYKLLVKKGILPKIPLNQQDMFKGSEMLGISYKPLFRVPRLRSPKSYKVYGADFVSSKEGTGVVHTALMYGEEDYQLGKKVGLPTFHTVDEQGRFIKALSEGLGGRYVKDLRTEKKIVASLKDKGFLFTEELYEHEYPHCWRCSTPLLYYAKESWFVATQKIKQALIRNNKTINWVPSHVKEGRMGEWLRDLKDWAFSRERYWGTPLPVWECKECKHVEAIGSLDELQNKGTFSNIFYILRHGESFRQKTSRMSSWPEKTKVPLTPKGRRDTEKLAKMLKKKHIDYIFSSDLLRAKQTAEILAKELTIKPVFAKSLREVDVGALNNKHVREIGRVWGKKGETSLEHYLRRFEEPLPKGESWVQVRRRMVDFVRDIERTYKGKTILLISHELPISLLETALRGLSREETIAFRQQNKIEPGEMRTLPPFSLPLNNDGEVDLHRPYVDEVKFPCTKCKKGTMERVREVVDVWFDSGAMPFAQAHWMGGALPKLFPADYIVEAVDQTRGWFYTLLAVSTLLGFKAPFRNVICLSHVLDEKGEKMSKSKGNVVDPWEMINKYGIDAVRWYFFTINNPGDPKLFSEKDIQEVLRKFILTLWNSFVFYQTYVLPKPRLGFPKRGLGGNTLDRWILSRLSTTVKEVTMLFDAYDVTGAGRSLENFVINDLSLWYIRRSRQRFQNPRNKSELKEASHALGFVLSEVCKLASPFIPFLAEHIFGELGNKESVHWQNFPQLEKKLQDTKLEQNMAWVRSIVAKSLALRGKAGIKVRQPLAVLKIRNSKLKISKDLLNLLADELNVKQVVFDKTLTQDVELDTRITPKLKEEGMVREITRAIQEMRKDAGYKPSQRIILWYGGDAELMTLIMSNAVALKKGVGAKTLQEKPTKKIRFDKEKEMEIDSKPLWLGIKKI